MAALTLVLAAPAVAASGPGIEQPQLRTETSSTFRTGQDRWVTRFATSPLNFRDEAGAWQRIDTRLVDSGREGYAYRTAATPYGLELPSDLGAGPVRFTSGAEWVGFGLTGARPRDVEASGTSARYPSALDGVDLRYDALAEGVKETLVLRDASAPGAYGFRLSTSLGLEPRVEEGGRVDFVRPDGTVAFHFASPFMEDASGSTSRAIKVSLQPRLDGWLMTLRPDARWLRAEERSWPVQLDPTVRVAPTHECVYIRQTSNAQGSVCDGPDYVADNTGGSVKRPLMRFDVRSLPFASVITNATLRLYSTGDHGSVAVHQALKPWTLGATWHTYDGVNPWTNLGGDYTATAAATTSVTSGWHSWNITALANAWVNAQQPNHGLIALGEARKTHKFSTSQRAGQAPYLEVTFVSETVRPTLDEPEHTPPLPTGWVHAVALRVKGTANDVGTGLQRMMLNRPTPSGTVTDTQFFKCDPTLSPTCNPDTETMCGGTWDSRCPMSGSKTFDYNTSTLAEGIVRPSLVARDAAANDSLPRDWQLKVDHTGPTATLTGTARNPEGGVVYDEQDYDLRVAAEDSSPNGPRAGVKSIELLVDDRDPHPNSGDYRRTRSGPCDSCPWTQDFVWRADEYSAGRHKLTVRLTDFAGNVRTEDWHVTIHRAGALGGYAFVSPDASGLLGPEDPGEVEDVNVNVANGNLLLSEPDADPEYAAEPEDIDLIRYLNSLAPVSGSHGPRWTSLSGMDIRLRRNDDGSITFFGPSHYVARFARQADGTYVAPRGLDSTLTVADGTYTLSTHESGEQFRFGCDSCRVGTITDPGGNRTTFNYRADGTPESATDELGRTTAFTVDAGRRITRIDAPGGRVFRYAYNGAGLLESYTGPAGRVTSYTYDSSNRLTRVARPDGPVTRFTYSGPQGGRRVASMTRVTDTVNDTGPTTGFAYTIATDGTGSTAVTDPNGRTTTYRSLPDHFVDVATSGGSPPGLALSGALWDRRDGTLADDGTTYALAISASSGAGIANVEVQVDGAREDFAEQSCTCGMSRTFTLDPQDFPAGERVVTITTTDNEGDVRTQRFRVTLAGPPPTAPIAGDAADEAPAEEPSAPAASSTDGDVPRLSLNEEARAQSSEDAFAEYTEAWPNAPDTVETAQAQQDTNVFAGANADGLPPTGQPPDPTGAIGIDHYVQMTNFQIQAYDRQLQPARGDAPPMHLDQFAGVNEFPTVDEVYDPQIVWDESSNRWFYAAAAGRSDEAGRMLVFGWSVTSDPTTFARANGQANPTDGWCKYRTRAVATQDDFPKLGVSRNHILIGANAFRAGEFVSARVRVARKPSKGQRRCTAARRERRVRTFNLRARDPRDASQTTPAFTPVPVNSSATNTNGYVVASAPDLRDAENNPIARTTLNLWRVVGRTGRPRLRGGRSVGANIPIPEFRESAPVPQNGTDPFDDQPYSRLEAQDGRLMQAFADVDPTGRFVIWTTHEVAADDQRAVVRWYRVDARAATQRNGTLDIPGAFAFYPAIAPATNGSTVMVNYNVATGDLPTEIRARSGTVNSAGDLTFGSEIVVAPGEAMFSRQFCGQRTATICRWGDYAAATPDRANPNVVWGTAMRAGPDGNYRTRNFSIAP